jgi:acetyl-CoA C-acetyltransferase
MGGALSSLTAPQLGGKAIETAVSRAGVDPQSIYEVIMGHVVQAGAGQAPARQAALNSGLPPAVGATTINKVCGSGLKAVMLAANAIQAGEGDVFVAGGQESMSNAPYLVHGARDGIRFGHGEFKIRC